MTSSGFSQFGKKYIARGNEASKSCEKLRQFTYTIACPRDVRISKTLGNKNAEIIRDRTSVWFALRFRDKKRYNE